ncbi:hypothetical protein RRG39_01940 [Mycoplasmopsis cynos]|uniref:hypothetical protein n=1 Tax=Mycoplasmopsis cynos TaxID=171284 RepID=UPI002AFE71F5|nr:hypothetical protein [Mycoplasmopsis cynos]WQQ17285.1 hypothetical protein RRG39_01940 [Mycoplasmopsis cynos]
MNQEKELLSDLFIENLILNEFDEDTAKEAAMISHIPATLIQAIFNNFNFNEMEKNEEKTIFNINANY